LVGEIAAGPPGPLSGKAVNRDTAYEVGTMSEPLGVSVIIVNYNNACFLGSAIDSALGQTHPYCEVIVVDDYSTDNSQAVIERYGDRIISVLRETNGGQTAALNSAWPLTRYPILIFLDSDDVLSRMRLLLSLTAGRVRRSRYKPLSCRSTRRDDRSVM
jgi:glycosyltransferase involved in cell wall biosynthesis